MSQDIEMAEASAVSQPTSKPQKSQELFATTIKSPPFGYAHLELLSDSAEPGELDNLQVRSYCTAALRQFLGDTGVSIPLDILKVQRSECWLRVPRQDLGAFSGAITAFPGLNQGGSLSLLRLRACGDWLGALVGRAEQDRLWNP
jgi:ribonuclease P/MRP protein subunit POP8